MRIYIHKTKLRYFIIFISTDTGINKIIWNYRMILNFWRNNSCLSKISQISSMLFWHAFLSVGWELFRLMWLTNTWMPRFYYIKVRLPIKYRMASLIWIWNKQWKNLRLTMSQIFQFYNIPGNMGDMIHYLLEIQIKLI